MYYFDNCATTKVDDEIAKIIQKYHTELYFNPSTLTSAGLAVRRDLEKARGDIAALLGGVLPEEIVFTSGGTEADNMFLFGAVKSKKGNVVATASEHSAVYNALLQLKNRGVELRFADIEKDGHIDVGHFLSLVDENTLLAVAMHVNNETGAVNDIRSLCAAVKAKNKKTLVFSDGVQAVGKIPVDVKVLGVDGYALSGHKIHGSKGSGALFVRKGTHIHPFLFGGGQEYGLRSGTEYVAGQIALAQALRVATENLPENTAKFVYFKEILTNAVADIPHSRVNCTENVSPAVFSCAFAGVKGEVLLRMLEEDGFLVGTGSACSSKNKVSRMASAMKMDKKYAEGILRISFSKYNDSKQVTELAASLIKNVALLRKNTGVTF